MNEAMSTEFFQLVHDQGSDDRDILAELFDNH